MIRRVSIGVALVLVVSSMVVAQTLGAQTLGAQAQGTQEAAFPDDRFAPVLPSSVAGDTAVVALAADPPPSDGVAVGTVAARFRPDTSVDVQSVVDVWAGSPGVAEADVAPGSTTPSPDAGGVWATAGGRQVTPVFSYEALVAPSRDGSLPGSRWGSVQAFGIPQPGGVEIESSSPSLAVANRALEVTTDAAPASVLLDQPVVSVRDFVRLAGSQLTAVSSTDFIIVDRVTGQIQLIEASDGTLTDVSGDGAWVGAGLPADPGAPTTLSFDLPALATLVGVEPADDTLAVSVDRTYALADGRVVTSYGVAATLGWFARAAEQAAGVAEVLATTTTTVVGDEVAADAITSDSDGISDGVLVALAVAVGALLVVLLLLAWQARRRRSRRRASPEEALAAFDAQMADISQVAHVRGTAPSTAPPVDGDATERVDAT